MIQIDHLSKRYGDLSVVDDISFSVPAGSVTGFLGPNGAGKSTTLRCLTGLTRPTQGSATIHGVDYRNLPNPAMHVGCLLDAAAQHDARTGREVLTLGAMAMGLPRTRVDEVLELVGLTASEAKKRLGTYSLGMRQRLGIGHALLGNPRVLVLDEPANGLDPQGIHWMRWLLRNFADAGGSVLLSSHLLHEVQQVADHIVMIGQGRIVTQGSTAELLSSGQDLEQMFLQLTASTARGAVPGNPFGGPGNPFGGPDAGGPGGGGPGGGGFAPQGNPFAPGTPVAGGGHVPPHEPPMVQTHQAGPAPQGTSPWAPPPNTGAHTPQNPTDPTQQNGPLA